MNSSTKQRAPDERTATITAIVPNDEIPIALTHRTPRKLANSLENKQMIRYPLPS